MVKSYEFFSFACKWRGAGIIGTAGGWATPEAPTCCSSTADGGERVPTLAAKGTDLGHCSGASPRGTRASFLADTVLASVDQTHRRLEQPHAHGEREKYEQNPDD